MISLWAASAISLMALAVFSACEAALTSVSRIRLRHWAGKRLLGSDAGELLERPRALLTMVFVGSNLSLVGFALCVTALLVGYVPGLERWPLLAAAGAVVVGTPPAVLLGDVLPRAFVHEHAGRLLGALVAGGRVLNILFWPYIALTRAVSWVLFRLLGIPSRHERQFTASSVDSLLREGEREGLVDRHEREIIGDIFALGETPVREVMTPRTDVVAISLGASRAETARRIWETGFSRFPVTDGSPDNIVGLVHAVDVLKAREGERLRIRPTLFVPETMTCDQLLYAMRRQRIQLAVVVDEYGGMAGIVTMEDLVEELVGDIRDEHDREAPATDGGQGLIVDAGTRLSDLRHRLEQRVRAGAPPAPGQPGDGDVGDSDEARDDSVAAHLLRRLGRVPARGERFTVGDLAIEVVQATPKRILRVRVTGAPANTPDGPRADPA
ncbi:MAG TPA: hemolysin family protein [Gemmatimonadota bacterium]